MGQRDSPFVPFFGWNGGGSVGVYPPEDVAVEAAKKRRGRRAPEPPRAVIEYVLPESPADDAGFTPGCIITSVDGQPVRDMIDWRWLTADDFITLGYIDTDGEAGEVAEKLKKIIRNHDGNISELDLVEFTKELGDVLWYLAMMSHQVGLSLEDVAATNLAKLSGRKERSVIKSTGDNR